MAEAGVEKENRFFAGGLFFSSGILLVSVLGKGQVDIYSLFFLLLGIKYLLKKDYVKMSLLFGLSAVIKPFPLVMIAPVLLLLMKDCGFQVAGYGILILLPGAADRFFTRVLMPDYQTYVDITSREFRETFGFSRVEQLFSARLFGIPLFFTSMGLLLAFCFYLGVRKKTEPQHLLIFPALSYVILCAFYSATFYWYVTVLPILAYMGCCLLKKSVAVFFLLLNTCGMLLTMIFNAGGMGMAVLSPLFGETKAWTAAEKFAAGTVRGLSRLGTMMFIFSMLAVVLIYAGRSLFKKEGVHEG